MSDEFEPVQPSTKPETAAWSSGNILGRSEWFFALALTLVAVWFHLYFVLHAGGLWRDEVNTVNVASRHSLGEMANDSFPILTPLMVRGWMAPGLGASDQGLRCLGGIVGLGLLAAFWTAAWTLRRSPPTFSLVLFGLNTTVIIFGDSLRAFGLGSLLAVLLIAAMGAFLLRPSWGRAGLLALAAVLSVQALFQNAIFVAAVCAGGWAVCARRRTFPAAAKILGVALVAAASLLPYWSRVQPLAEAAPTTGISTLRTEFHPAIALSSLGGAAGFPFAAYLWVWGILAVLVMVFAAMSWRASGSLSAGSDLADAETGDLPLFAAVTLLTGLGGFLAFLWWAALRTQPWYFLPALAMAATCFELGIPKLHRHVRVVVLAFVAVTAVLAIPSAWRGVHWRFTNVDLLAQRLMAEAAPGDFILVTPWNRGISFARYYHGEASWETVPPLADHSSHRYDLLQRQTLTGNVMRPVFDRMAATLQAGHRVWVVGAMEIPEVRASVPADLGPPPRKHTGWSAGPYVRRWTEQAGQFLENQSRQFVEVPINVQGVNPNEALELSVAQGREASETSSVKEP